MFQSPVQLDKEAEDWPVTKLIKCRLSIRNDLIVFDSLTFSYYYLLVSSVNDDVVPEVFNQRWSLSG